MAEIGLTLNFSVGFGMLFTPHLIISLVIVRKLANSKKVPLLFLKNVI